MGWILISNILMRFGGQVDREWRFLIDGKESRCPVRGNRIANDGDLVRTWCVEGRGLALKSVWDVHDDLGSGALVQILKAFSPPSTTLQIVYPAGAIQPRRVKLVINHLTAWFSRNGVFSS